MSRWFPLVLSLVLATLTGCGGGAPSVPTDEPEVRDVAAGIWNGQVTLNGSVTTSPSYKDPPYTLKIAGKAGEIALVTLSAKAIPATSKYVLVRFRGATVDYGSRLVRCGGGSSYFPLYLTATEEVSFIFYNTAASGIYPEAVKWTWDIRSRPAEDVREPNDDENPATIADRTLATVLPLNIETYYSFYQRVPATLGQDREDWYRLDFPEDQTQLTLGGAGDYPHRWGKWEFDTRLYDPTGTLIEEHLDSIGFSMVVPGLTRGPHYLQVVGRVIEPPHASVAFIRYRLNAVAYPTASWQTHAFAEDTFCSNIDAKVIDGRLAIAYGSDTGLSYARALVEVPQSSADWETHIVDSYFDGGSPTLLEYSGRVWLTSEGDIRSAATSDPHAAADWSTLALFSSAVSRGLIADNNRLFAIAGKHFAESLVPIPQSVSDWRITQPMIHASEITAVAVRDGRPALLAVWDNPSDHYGPYMRFCGTTSTSPLQGEWLSHSISPGILNEDERTFTYGRRSDLSVWNNRFVAVYDADLRQCDNSPDCWELRYGYLSTALVDEPAQTNHWATTEYLANDETEEYRPLTNVVQHSGHLYLSGDSQDDGIWVRRTADPVPATWQETYAISDYNRYALMGGLVDLNGHLVSVSAREAIKGLYVSYELTGW